MRRKLFWLTVVAVITVSTNAVATDPVEQVAPPNVGQEFLDKMADAIRRENNDPSYVHTPDEIEVRIEFNNLDPDRSFLEELAARVLLTTPIDDFHVDRIAVGRVDLNGDGQDELIVYFNSTYFCGSAPECDVSIYHNDGEQWRYVGEITSINGNVAYFRDKRHNGWLAFQYSESNTCWLTPSEIQDFYKKANKQFDEYGPIVSSASSMGQQIDPEFGGYLYLPDKEPCWAKSS